MSIDQVTSQLTSGIAKLVLVSFDRNIFLASKSSIKRAQIFFLYIFQNHRGITVVYPLMRFVLKSGNS